jgi:hypothetical protein
MLSLNLEQMAKPSSVQENHKKKTVVAAGVGERHPKKPD